MAERLERNNFAGCRRVPSSFRWRGTSSPETPSRARVSCAGRRERAALGVGRGAGSGREGPVTPADLAQRAMVHLQRYATDDAQQGINTRRHGIAGSFPGAVPGGQVDPDSQECSSARPRPARVSLSLDYALVIAATVCRGSGRKTKASPVYIAAEGGAGIWKRIAVWHRLRHMDLHDAHARRYGMLCRLRRKAGRTPEAIEKTERSPFRHHHRHP